MQPRLTSDCDLSLEKHRAYVESGTQNTTSCEDEDKEEEIMTLPRVLLQIPFAQWQRILKWKTGLIYTVTILFNDIHLYSFFEIFLRIKVLRWLYTAFLPNMCLWWISCIFITSMYISRFQVLRIIYVYKSSFMASINLNCIYCIYRDAYVCVSFL